MVLNVAQLSSLVHVFTLLLLNYLSLFFHLVVYKDEVAFNLIQITAFVLVFSTHALFEVIKDRLKTVDVPLSALTPLGFSLQVLLKRLAITPGYRYLLVLGHNLTS